MENTKPVYSSVDEYIAAFPPEAREHMRALREVIAQEAPQAREKISWQMPTFTLYGNLVHFAAHQKHIGFYPAPSAILAFEKELAGYQTSKGAIRFPLDRPLPLDLIRRIVAFRVEENLNNAGDKP